MMDSRGGVAPTVIDVVQALEETMVDSRGRGVTRCGTSTGRDQGGLWQGEGHQLGWMHVFTMTPRCPSGEHRLMVTQATLRSSRTDWLYRSGRSEPHPFLLEGASR